MKARVAQLHLVRHGQASAISRDYDQLLRDGTVFQDLGANHFDRTDRTKTAMRLTRRLQQLGYTVELRPAA